MPSRKNAKLTFASAIIFLFVAGAAAGIAIVRLTRSLQWVAHTYDVQVALGDIGATMTVAGRVRSSFDTTGAGEFSRKFDATAALLPGKLNNLARLVSDNPAQSASIARLRDIENRRLAVLNDAIHRRERGPVDEVDQKAIKGQ